MKRTKDNCYDIKKNEKRMTNEQRERNTYGVVIPCRF